MTTLCTTPLLGYGTFTLPPGSQCSELEEMLMQDFLQADAIFCRVMVLKGVLRLLKLVFVCLQHCCCFGF